MLEKINKPYPFLLNRLYAIVLIPLFVAVFMLLFQPFGLQSIPSEQKYWILLGYGLVTGIVLIVFLAVLPRLFSGVFSESGWTIWKQFIWILSMVLCIALANYAYSVKIFLGGWFGIKGFLLFAAYTLLVAVIPVTGIILYRNFRLLKNNLASQQLLNDILMKEKGNVDVPSKEFTVESGNQTYAFASGEVLFIESDGNYVHIHFVNDGKTEVKMLRNTLKGLEAKLEGLPFYRTHRAFMVNLEQIAHVSGNSQGLLLELKYESKKVPVSRQQVEGFTQALEQRGLKK